MSPTDLENPPLSMGLKVASKDVMVVEPDGLEPVPLGQPGELLVH